MGAPQLKHVRSTRTRFPASRHAREQKCRRLLRQREASTVIGFPQVPHSVSTDGSLPERALALVGLEYQQALEQYFASCDGLLSNGSSHVTQRRTSTGFPRVRRL